MTSLLGALLRNESGGRNVANTHQGTSSGQAQGYFQITTGTWNDFGGQKYAATPMGATYAQQAEIASKIPLSRWDKSTQAAMRGTGRPIDLNRTLGENLTAAGEGFGAGPDLQNSVAPQARNMAPASVLPQRPGQGQPTISQPITPQQGPSITGSPSLPQVNLPTRPGQQRSGPIGTSTEPIAPMQGPPAPVDNSNYFPPAPAPPGPNWRNQLADALTGGANAYTGAMKTPAKSAYPSVNTYSTALGAEPIIDVNTANAQRQAMAQAIARMNAGQLYG